MGRGFVGGGGVGGWGGLNKATVNSVKLEILLRTDS